LTISNTSQSEREGGKEGPRHYHHIQEKKGEKKIDLKEKNLQRSMPATGRAEEEEGRRGYLLYPDLTKEERDRRETPLGFRRKGIPCEGGNSLIKVTLCILSLLGGKGEKREGVLKKEK